MAPLYIFEDSHVDRLYPLTYMRAACELRCGALSLLERVRRNLRLPIAGILVRSAQAPTLSRGLVETPVNPALSTREGLLLINARWLLLKEQADAWLAEPPPPDSAGISQGAVVWAHLSAELAGQIDLSRLQESRTLEAILARVQRCSAPVTLIDRPWDLLSHQTAALLEDFAAMGPKGGTVLPGAHLLNVPAIHLATGARVWAGAVLDAQGGPIIIGEDAEIHANAVVTGPAAIGARCIVRNQADIRENTTLGPGCRVGGEVSASIFLGHSNKQHYGFVGDSIVGEWVNLGAGTTTSNVKNTYGQVKVPLGNRDEPSGRQFMGAIIADHAKLGIGTYLSTGTVIGFASHVVTPRPPRFVPSFGWLTERGMQRADFEKLERIADIVLKRRHREFTPEDHELWVRIASEYATSERYAWPDEEAS